MSFATAYARWAAVGPYYAMFPLNLAHNVVHTYTKPGQRVFDPFAGRASSVFAGAAHGRPSVGIEINPVGWIYGKTKLAPASAELVTKRIDDIVQLSSDISPKVEGGLVEFFKLCFTETSLRFLIAARENLDWKQDDVDRTLMTLILIDLHGRRNKSFSNQMRQSKAMSPDYSIAWWRKRKSAPPDIDPKKFLEKKIAWRYAKGTPLTTSSDVLLGDSCDLIETLWEQIPRKNRKPMTLLFTSPPYMGITDYHRDQWLRLWMLGERPVVARSGEKNKGAFASKTAYKELLRSVFLQCAELMNRKGYVYLRTDARECTFEVTREVLREAFPRWHEVIVEQPFEKQTQTALFGDTSPKPGEKDIILSGPTATKRPTP
jgi:hypothetical protein